MTICEDCAEATGTDDVSGWKVNLGVPVPSVGLNAEVVVSHALLLPLTLVVVGSSSGRIVTSGELPVDATYCDDELAAVGCTSEDSVPTLDTSVEVTDVTFGAWVAVALVDCSVDDDVGGGTNENSGLSELVDVKDAVE